VERPASQKKGFCPTDCADSLDLCVSIFERLYGTGRDPQARITLAVVFIFSYLPKAFFFSRRDAFGAIENKKGNSRDEERMGSKGKKMQMGFSRRDAYGMCGG